MDELWDVGYVVKNYNVDRWECVKTAFPIMEISIMKIKWSQDHCIFTMGIIILVR